MSSKSAYKLEVGSDPNDAAKTVLSWTVRVNTGGWSMRTDHVEVDSSGGSPLARVYVVLEGPRGDEPVGQAFHTHEGSQTLDANVARAELWIRRTTRGSAAKTTFELATQSDQ